MSDSISAGRADLARWQEGQPDDFYAANPVLRALVARDLDPRREAALQAFGQRAARELDPVVQENNLARNLPELGGWDGIGRPAERVRHHPSYHEAGRIIYGSGIMAAYREDPVPHRYILGLMLLSCHAGEAGHNCPLACTAGAIRAIKAAGTTDQKARWLPRLLDPDWDKNWSGAQFLTEVQGGSDVGANGTHAQKQADGSWRIFGEKWFCSNADADIILMTARVGNTQGTPGLGLFAVPALVDGKPNAYRVRRLKDKLGTRSMASGEIDFEGAHAEALGPVDKGFALVMNEVINTSRLYNAFAVCGHMGRANLVARGYAQHRQAFGGPIERYPLVQRTLANMASDYAGALVGSWLLAGMQERLDQGLATQDERAFFRVALNLNKLRTCIQAHEVVNAGIEVLGGNGAIETFSVLPRLLRDNVVCENWEGTHNVLRLQVLRDCKRLGVHEGFFRFLRDKVAPSVLAPVEADFLELMAQDDEVATLRMVEAADRMATLVQIAGFQGLPDRFQPLARLLSLRHVEGLPRAGRATLDLYRACLQ